MLGTVLGEDLITSDIWIGVEDQLPHKILLSVPSDAGDPMMVHISLSEFDAPVTIDPP